ncbi:MAG: hypothetical protein K5Q68_21995 [Roseococcus sp.]|nr:hypothetical protein [Roseococcus sp.]
MSAEARFDILYERVGGISKAADLAGMGLQALAKWRDGRARPPFWPVAKLAAEAKVSLRWLATGEEPMEEEAAPAPGPPRLTKTVDLFRLVDAFDQARERLGPVITRKMDSYRMMEMTLLIYDTLSISRDVMRAHPPTAAADAPPGEDT